MKFLRDERVRGYLKKYRWIIAIYVLAMLVFIFGDRSSFEIYKLSQDRSSPGIVSSSADKTVYPLKITDFKGREITIAKMPQRIISLTPSSTEILFQIGAGSRVVGVTAYDDYPAEVESLPKVGDFNGPNLEAIVKENPDIIFASDLSGQEQVEALEKNGFTVAILEANNLNQIMESINKIGQITDTQKQSNEVALTMQNRLNEITKKVKDLPKVKTFYLVDINGNWTAGKGTFIDELITLGGGENITTDVQGWVKYSVEKIVEKNPSVIITAPHAGDTLSIAKMPGYKDTTAAKNNLIYVVSDDNIISRPAYRIILGLEEIAKFLHPEAFR